MNKPEGPTEEIPRHKWRQRVWMPKIKNDVARLKGGAKYAIDPNTGAWVKVEMPIERKATNGQQPDQKASA